MSDLSLLSLVKAAAAVAEGSVSPVELLEASLRQVAKWEPTVKALVGSPIEGVERVARRRAEEAARGELRGPLHGVPVMLKDLMDMAGELTTASSRILSDNRASADAPVTARLRKAGAVIVAKTNVHEFAYGAKNPPTANPWDPRRIPGGSSGGSAAAVASHMCHGALGSDTAASIRQPAALCGLVGIKPTYGRVPLRGIIPCAWSLDAAGPITRSVADARLMLEVIEGPDIQDPTTVSLPSSPPARPLSDSRIGVVTELMSPNQPEVTAVLNRTLSRLEETGAELRQVSIGDPEEMVAALFIILTVESASYHRRWLEERPQDYGSDVREYLELGMQFRGVDFVDAQRLRRAVKNRINQALEECDLLFAPAQHILAPLMDDHELTLEDGSRETVAILLCRSLLPFNLSGHCGVSVPVTHARGLPVGVQLIGAPFADHALLDYAQQLHDLLEWSWEPPLLPS